jgi:Holliday junction resolvasome RuvABC endonuclease subunit
MSSIRVIGVDPSLSGTGIAYDDGQLATVKTKASDGNARLQPIYDAVYTAAGGLNWRGTPTLAVIEDLPVNAMSAGKTGQAQGVVRMALVAAGVSILALSPASLKKFATGKGNAKKPDMIAAWEERSGVLVKDDNQVDAAFLREYGRLIMGWVVEEQPWTVRYDPANLPKSWSQDTELARRVAQGYQVV